MRRATLLCLACLFLTSCGAWSYGSSLDSDILLERLTGRISGFEDYEEYSDKELSELFALPYESYDACVIYSRDSDDQGELGVIKASDEKSAGEILEALEVYLEAMRTERRHFIVNYLPDELSKLESADVRRYGSYVIYTVLEPEDARAVFDAAKEELSSP